MKVDQVLNYAQAELGKPYVFGDEGPNTFDCSGLMQWVYGKVGITLPRTSQEQQAWAAPVTTPKPGDLVFYGRPATHVGLYLGNGKMINAPFTGALVRVDDIGTPTSYGRVPGAGTAVAPLLGGATAGLGAAGAAVGTLLGGARHIVIETVVVGAGVLVAGVGVYLLAKGARR